MEKITLSEIIPILKGTYRNIDIRMILGKPKAKPGADWICIFLKIRLTNETEAELQEKFERKLLQLGQIESQNFRVILFQRQIVDLDSILGSIHKGSIFVDGEEVRLLSNESHTIFSKIVTLNSSYSTDDEMSGNSHRLVYLGMQNSIPTTIEELAITKTDMEGLELSQIHSWFDTANLCNANTINTVIVFPIYCKIFNVPHRKLWNTSAIFEIHELLIEECTAVIMDENNHKMIRRVKRNDTKILYRAIDSVLVAFPSIPTESILQSVLTITIRHLKIGEIAYRRINPDDVLSPPLGKSLYDAFSLYRTNLTLPEYSVSSSEKRQVGGITWLLALAGFVSVNLSQFQNKDESTIEERHSADILAYNPLTDSLLIIDCTVEIPDEKKIINIKNTAEYVTRRLGRQATPVVFSSVLCQGMKPFSGSIGVSLLDRSNVELLNATLSKGNDLAVLLHSMLISGY